MTPTEVYALFRSEVDDAAVPYFWSATEVQTYADRAEEMFCRLTGGIQDATSAITQLDITEGEHWVAYPTQILRIVTASLESTGRPLTILNPTDLQDNTKAWGPDSIGLSGRVVGLVLGLDDANIRVVQMPEEDDTVNLVIERLPLSLPSVAGSFEIPEQHHFYLLYWMKHLAYLKQDSQTFDKVKSEEESAKFKAYCAESFAEKERRKNKPRLMQYGGIGGSCYGGVALRRW